MKALLVTISALLVSTAATAQPVVVTADAAPTARVRYADLDLNADAGVRTLRDRVRAAARNLCYEGGVQTLDIHLSRTACFKSTYANGLDQVDQLVGARRAATKVAIGGK